MKDREIEILEKLGIDPKEFYSNFNQFHIVDKMPDLPPTMMEFTFEAERKRRKEDLDFLCERDWIDENCKPVKKIYLR